MEKKKELFNSRSRKALEAKNNAWNKVREKLMKNLGTSTKICRGRN